MSDSTTTIRSNFIPDGYTTTGYIAERPGVYFESRFSYRPVLHGERNKITADIGSAKDSNTGSMVIYTVLERQLVDWDQVDRNNKPLKPTKTNIARMAPEFIERLFNVVCGFGPSDIDPAKKTVEVPAVDELAALLEGGQAATDAQQEADAKN